MQQLQDSFIRYCESSWASKIQIINQNWPRKVLWTAKLYRANVKCPSRCIGAAGGKPTTPRDVYELVVSVCVWDSPPGFQSWFVTLTWQQIMHLSLYTALLMHKRGFTGFYMRTCAVWPKNPQLSGFRGLKIAGRSWFACTFWLELFFSAIPFWSQVWFLGLL